MAGASSTDALHAEWTKFRTLAGSWWLLLAVAALTVTVSAATAADFHCPPGACTARLTGADPARLGLDGRLPRPSDRRPARRARHRRRVRQRHDPPHPDRGAPPFTAFCSKALIVAAAAFAAGVLAVGGSVLAGALILPGNGLSAANGFIALSLG